MVYEKLVISYTIPESVHTYTPDFQLSPSIIVETKGIFDTDDRKKMKLVKAQHPHLDIRFVFSRASATIAKKSRTTYAKWAETHGFLWANRVIPGEWIEEAKKEIATSARS